MVGTARYDWQGARGCLEIFFGHHVAPDDDRSGDLRAQDLYDRLMYLRRTRELVSLAEGLDWLKRPRRGARLAALTFDDGYRDNLTHLLPVLQAAHAPATVFVATKPIVTGAWMWFDLARCALRRTGAPIALPWVTVPAAPGLSGWADQVMDCLQRSAPGLREPRLRELLGRTPTADPPAEPRHAVLTPPQLQQLAAHPLITIGAHTHSHTVLGACDETTALRELHQNLECLTRLTGTTPSFFAYPRGLAHDYSWRDQQLLAELGMEAAVTTRPGPNDPTTDPLALKRTPLGVGGVERFAWAVDLRVAGRRT